MDPVVEAVLLAIARTTPDAIVSIASALRGGKSPEEAVAEAKAAIPPRWDPSREDAERRARLKNST